MAWVVTPPTQTQASRTGWVTSPTTTPTTPQRGWLGSGSITIMWGPRGNGQLDVTTMARPNKAALLAGDGALSATLFKREFRTASLVGESDLRADYSQIHPAAPQFNSMGFLFGDTVSTHQEPEFSGGGTLSANTDGLTATVSPGMSVDALFNGEGILVGSYDEIHTVFVEFAAQGVLTGPLVPKLVADLAGSGAFTAVRVMQLVRAASLLGSGALSATGFAKYLRSIGFTGLGSLATLFQVGYPVQAGGTGTVGATVSQVYSPALALSSEGTLDAQAGLPVLPQFAGDGVLSAVPNAGYHYTDTFNRLLQLRDAALGSAGSLSATVRGPVFRNAAFSSVGSLSATAVSAAVNFTDDFNRANGAMGSNWATISAAKVDGINSPGWPVISGNAATVSSAAGTSGPGGAVYCTIPFNTLRQEVYLPTVGITGTTGAGVYLRYGYLLRFKNEDNYVIGFYQEDGSTNNFSIVTRIGGTETSRLNSNMGATPVRFRAVGNVYSFLDVGGAVIKSWTDSGNVFPNTDPTYNKAGIYLLKCYGSGGVTSEYCDSFTMKDI